MHPFALHQRRTLTLVLAALAVCAVARAQSAIDGFNPGTNDLVWASAIQPDGKIVVVGDFTLMGGGGTGIVARNHIARLNADGSLDGGFNPGANASVFTVAVQPDGKILVGGGFTMLGGGGTGTTARHRIGRLNADGSLDTGFNPDANIELRAFAIQPDGKILIAGAFTTIGGVERNRLARLNPDGSLDPGFNPGADATVDAMALQSNGQILVGGYFSTLGGGGTGTSTRNRIGRLNADGSLDASFNPGASDLVFALALQPDGKALVAGAFTLIGGGGTGSVTRNKIARLNADGSVDPAFDPGANNSITAMATQPDGKILVGGLFTGLGGGIGVTARNRLGRLNVDGSVDTSFSPSADNAVFSLAVHPDGRILAGGLFSTIATIARSRLARLYPDGSVEGDFNPGANINVTAVATQSDGQIVVGGDFSQLGGGGSGTTARSRLGRLNAAGVLDGSFNPGANSQVLALAVQPDGRILVGGIFTMLGGGGSGTTLRANIGRLNADGSLDSGFNPGASTSVFALAVQPDGKIVVGGGFGTLGGGGFGSTTRNGIGRLNADGSIDNTFNPGANGPINTVVLQPDGKILLGGEFTGLGGITGTTPRQHIGRLNPDGSVDNTFDPGADGTVNSIAVQADGRILVGGQFSMLGGGGTGTTARSRVGRLNGDGSLDAGFNPGANNTVFSIALQTDGRALVSGSFTTLGGGGAGTATRNRIGRLNADGTLDTGFDPGANNVVYALAPQADGKIVAAGTFTTLGSGGTGAASRISIGRLTNTGAAVQSLNALAGGTAVGWSRSGTGPDVSRVTFEVSADGTAYTPLGNGTRAAGGWRLDGASLPTGVNRFIRARGYYGTSYNDGSGSIVESIRSVFAVPCTYALSSSSASVPSGINSGSVTLTTNEESCPWTAPGNAFITVTSASAGTGTTLVTWVTSINPSPSPRIAAITIAGLTFTITQAGASTTRRVPNDFNHDSISDVAVFRPGLGRWFIIDQPNTDWGVAGDMPVPGDYDGDGNPDIAVFRPANGTWYVNGGATVVWGLPGDIPVPGDYDGDHVTDMAVFRPATGQFVVRGVGTVSWGLAGDLPVPADYNGDGVTDIAVYRPSTGTWYVRDVATAVWGFAADIPVPADYNGDGTADIAVFRPATGVWYIKDQYSATFGAPGDVPVPMDRSGDGIAELGLFRRATGTWMFRNHVSDGTETVLWGAAGDIPIGRALPPVMTMPGDFDGDRKADLTVFRPSTGDWVSLRSLSGFSDYTIHTFGLSSDTPVARDYDGDGKIDPAVFRPSTGRWFMLRSSTGFADYVTQDWGVSTDIPVPGDYDGDGKADVAVFRPSAGRWLIVLSSTNNTIAVSYDFGLSGDVPVPADFDGDGRTNIAVFRPSTGQWYIYNRSTATYVVLDWGLSGDEPAPADFDGDGKADLAVFRPSLGRWFIKSSIDGSYTIADWGLSGDAMVPADFDGDGKADIAVFRPSTGFWYVRGLFNRSWGLAGDKPGIKVP